jgi:ABC-2 type transport system ATP-binding protein
MDEAEHCHRLALIQRGQIIASGSPGEIKHTMMRGQVLEIAPDDPTLVIETLRLARDEGRISLGEISLYGAFVHVVVMDVEESRSSIREELLRVQVDPGRMEVIEPSLEDVFVACMQ